MDKRLYDLLKKAEMTKEAGAISTAKNKACQWGDEMKKHGGAVCATGAGIKTGVKDATKAVAAGIGTAKNKAAQVGEKAKKMVKSATLEKQASILDKLKGAGNSALAQGKELAGKGANLIEDNPTTASVLAGGAAGAGIGAGMAGPGNRLAGAAIGGAGGAVTGAALKFLVQMLQEHSQQSELAQAASDYGSGHGGNPAFDNTLKV